jgi:single-strand DNA-binding protein
MEKITITGLVATTPRHLVTAEGLPITSFRLASATRKFDVRENKWVEGTTNWYTISCFRQLAINVAKSVHKGERVIVSGDLRIRDWDNGETYGTSVEVEALSIGHDLCYGEAEFTRKQIVKDEELVPA